MRLEHRDRFGTRFIEAARIGGEGVEGVHSWGLALPQIGKTLRVAYIRSRDLHGAL
jgi:hypothetical protein